MEYYNKLIEYLYTYKCYQCNEIHENYYNSNYYIYCEKCNKCHISRYNQIYCESSIKISKEYTHCNICKTCSYDLNPCIHEFKHCRECHKLIKDKYHKIHCDKCNECHYDIHTYCNICKKCINYDEYSKHSRTNCNK